MGGGFTEGKDGEFRAKRHERYHGRVLLKREGEKATKLLHPSALRLPPSSERKAMLKRANEKVVHLCLCGRRRLGFMGCRGYGFAITLLSLRDISSNRGISSTATGKHPTEKVVAEECQPSLLREGGPRQRWKGATHSIIAGDTFQFHPTSARDYRLLTTDYLKGRTLLVFCLLTINNR